MGSVGDVILRWVLATKRRFWVRVEYFFGLVAPVPPLFCGLHWLPTLLYYVTLLQERLAVLGKDGMATSGQ